MRIITGTLKGRIFDSPKSSQTHPMSEKMRGALFNIFGDIEGLRVLDAFAGSGALGFEALSRGAASATLIESDRAAQKAITANTQTLGLDKSVQLVPTTANNWLSQTTDSFDIVIADPPYDDLPEMTILRLADRVEPGGIVALSLPPGATIGLSNEYELLSSKSYGDAQLQLYRRATA